MRLKYAFLQGLLFFCLSIGTISTQAAFYTTHPPKHAVVDSPKKVVVQPVTNDDDMDAPIPPPEKKHVKKHAFLAIFAVACGVLGIVTPWQFILLVYLFGLTAGISGTAGLKKYRHHKFLRILCYVGIVLGFIAVLFATIPILYLI